MTGEPGRSTGGLGRRRSWLTTAALFAAAVSLPAAGLTALSATTAAAATPVQIGKAPVLPHNAVRMGATASSPLQLSVELSPRDPAALTAFATAVSDPHSAEYKHYLAKGEFASLFGPTQATIDAVTGDLRAEGLNPGPVSPDGLTIPITTTTATAGTALHTGFANYKLATGRTVFANTAAPTLPASVAGSVTAILGLNNIARPTDNVRMRKAATLSSPVAPQPDVTPAPNSTGPTLCSAGVQSLAGFTDTKDYWEPHSLSAAGAYNTAQLYGGYGNTGAGVTVAVFELEPFSTVDIAQAQTCLRTHVPVTTTTVLGGPTNPAASIKTFGVGFESALDIESIAGLAPGLSAIHVYEGRNGATGTALPETDASDLATYQQIVTDDTAQVISSSWGLCEQLYVDAGDQGALTAENSVFEEAAAQGQSLIAASGDSGSTDCFGTTFDSSTLTVDDPASQPFVTGAGGTSMVGSGTPTQSAWNEPALPPSTDNPLGSPGAATGGGVSQIWSNTPGDFHGGIMGAGYSNACGAPAGTVCRQVPDVAALADDREGFTTWYGFSTSDPADRAGIYFAGGTSLAAPLWAAITALADSSTACAANGPAGFLNTALYQNPTAMRDVTTGNNDVLDSGFTGGLYQAGPGYDLTTGLGTPNAPAVVEVLCATVPTSAGSSFVPVAPVRVLDTRNRTGVPGTTPIPANTAIKLQLTGTHGVPASGVTSVVLNVTSTGSTAGGDFTVFPDGTPRPATSNLNFSKNETIPNLVTVPVGKDGAVDIYNLAGTTHAVADLEGYYTTDAGSLYDPVTPVRVLDTRNAIGIPTRTPIGANKSIKLQIAGTHGVPATGATAVVLNVTATASTAGGDFTVFPDGTARPTASNLNFTKNETIPNLVTVQLGSDGAVDIYNLAGTTHAVADLAGYYTGTGTGLKFHSSAPHRLVDTRNGTGVATGQHTPIGANATFSLPLTDVHGLGNLGPLGSATTGALALNVTVTAPTVSGSVLTVFPSGVAKPGVSNLNYSAGETIPNAVLTPTKGTSINFTNLAGTTQVVVDLFGYFSTS